MAFINEYIEEKNFFKFELDTLFQKYYSSYDYKGVTKGAYPKEVYFWTIDKKREIWFMFMLDVRDPRPGQDFPIYTNEKVFILNYKGVNMEVKLLKSKNSSRTSKENPYYIIWECASLVTESLIELNKVETNELLQEVLTVYGVSGIIRQVENTIVKYVGCEE